MLVCLVLVCLLLVCLLLVWRLLAGLFLVGCEDRVAALRELRKPPSEGVLVVDSAGRAGRAGSAGPADQMGALARSSLGHLTGGLLAQGSGLLPRPSPVLALDLGLLSAVVLSSAMHLQQAQRMRRMPRGGMFLLVMD